MIDDADRSDRHPAPLVGAAEALHAELDRELVKLHVLHEKRLRCAEGCSSCCVDGLTVFEVEAEPIRRHFASLLADGQPHPAGACAFLGAAGACRIYPHRPYVCRSQGLPLRWREEADAAGEALEIVERRDICPLNDAGDDASVGLVGLVDLPADQCWTLGPFEERLARMQLEADAWRDAAARGTAARVALRSLFPQPPSSAK